MYQVYGNPYHTLCISLSNKTLYFFTEDTKTSVKGTKYIAICPSKEGENFL